MCTALRRFRTTRWLQDRISLPAGHAYPGTGKPGTGKSLSPLIRPTARISLEILAVLVALLAGAAGFLAWRISQGPLEVTILNQTIEDAVNEALPGGSFSIRDTVLDWSSSERELIFRFSDMELQGAEGETVATIPEMTMQVSLEALARGVMAPAILEMSGASLRLERTEEEGITFGLEAYNPEAAAARAKAAQFAPQQVPEDDATRLVPSFVDPLFDALAAPPDPNSVFGYLRLVRITNARLVYDEQVNGYRLRAEQANVTLSRSDLGLSGELTALSPLGGDTVRFSLEGVLPEGGDVATVRADIRDLNPAELAKISPAFADYDALDVPLDAEGSLLFSKTAAVTQANLQLSARRGRVFVPAIQTRPLELRSLDVDLSLDTEKRRLTLKTLDYASTDNEARVTGHVDYQVSEGFNVASLDTELILSDVKFAYEDLMADPVRIARVNVSGGLDLDREQVDIRRVRLTDGPFDLGLSGRVTYGAPGMGLDLEGTFRKLSLERLLALWPVDMGEGARSWVAANMKGGTLQSGTIRADITPVQMAAANTGTALPSDAIDIAFALTDTSVRYIPGMPPFVNVDGRGHLMGDSFGAEVTKGQIDLGPGHAITLKRGSFLTTGISKRQAPGTIDVDLEGAIGDLLTVLDMPPLSLISQYGVDPTKVGGDVEANAVLKMPLIKALTMAQVDITVDAKTKGLALADIVGDQGISDGDLDISVTGQGLDVSGSLSFADVPMNMTWSDDFTGQKTPRTRYSVDTRIDDEHRRKLGFTNDEWISGPVGLHADLTGEGSDLDRAEVTADLTGAELRVPVIDWIKKTGEVANAEAIVDLGNADAITIPSLSLKGPRINVEGSLAMTPDGTLKQLDFPAIRLDDTFDFAAHVGAGADGEPHYRLEGTRVDLRPLLSDLFASRTKSDTDDAKAAPEPAATQPAAPTETRKIDISLKEVLLFNDAVFRLVEGELVLADFLGTSLSLKGVDQSWKPFEMHLPPETGQGRRMFEAQAENAGALLKAFDLVSGIEGGSLLASADLQSFEPPTDISGHLVVEDFRLVDAPVLAQILTFGSLTGIADTLAGEGIRFKKLDLPFDVTSTRVNINDAKLYGPSVGLTARGQVERGTDVIDLDGTLIPAYSINTILSAIPMIGPLLTGRDGEGIFGITFSVRGKPSEVEVRVNPLSVFAPGVFRRIFEFGSDLPPEAPPPAADPSASDTAPAG